MSLGVLDTRLRFGRRLYGAAATLAVLLAPSARALATESAPSAEHIKSAAAEYDAGRRAFTDKKFEEAAIHFENAYHDAPNAQTLRNAMRARAKAGQLGRAGTLAALAESKYASDVQTVAAANETLAAVAPQLHRVTISCEPECGVAADGRVASIEDATRITLYFEPGSHAVVVSWTQERSRPLTVDARAGASQEVTLTAPPIPVAAPSTVKPPPPVVVLPPPPPPEKPSEKPLGRAPFFIGAGLTVASAGALVWSGLDTLANPGVDAVRTQCVNLGESCPAYQAGRSAQLRTNVLVGVTAGLGVATGIVGLFFTRWRAAPSETARLLPTLSVTERGAAAGLSGAF